MFHLRILYISLFLSVSIPQVFPLDNGLALTPPMGWMSWGYYMCADECEANPNKCLNETVIMAVADIFHLQGYQEAGYEYIIIDDCWSERERDQLNGRLVPDKKRFPRGMKFLADYIHARGLKFGMYANIALRTCMNYPGSKNNFKLDAQTFANWDVDYLKVDGCFVSENELNTAYVQIGKELNKTGRPMIYSCSWPYYVMFTHKHSFDYNKVVKTCNLWRNYHDISVDWSNVLSIIDYYEKNARKLKPFHGPGHWHDPDMLIIGTNRLKPGQGRIHMVMWAMWSAPLLISCDVTRIPKHERALLLNMELLAIAQDPMGDMAIPYKLERGVTMWVKRHLPKKNGAPYLYSFACINIRHHPMHFKFSPWDFGLSHYTNTYAAWNILEKKFIKNITIINATLEFFVPPEDVVMYTLYPIALLQ